MTDSTANNEIADHPSNGRTDSGSASNGHADAERNEDAAPHFAQTVVDEAAQHDSDIEVGGGFKQCQDLAFAAAVLQLGYANTRSLSLATKTWTTYGVSGLGDHLVSTELITAEQQSEAQQRAERRLNKLVAREQGENGNNRAASLSAQSEIERDWLSSLDPTGNLASLLGIADTSVLTDEQIEDRKLGSRYTLLRKIGQGGLGTVWLARDQNLQRYVAIKEISRNVSEGDPALDHFRREAEITGRLEHPGIVPVYQYGEDSDTGKSFYAMRFLGKETMQDAICEYHERRDAGDHDPMLRHRLLTALVSVCQAVGHAHSRKVIHRDLKPENIAFDGFGQVTLLDWGLAKINDATGMHEVNGRIEPGDLHCVGASQGGQLLGTPLYMAPEQAAGRLSEVDELTDVFGLGGILYAILTGNAPHQSAIEDLRSSISRSGVLSKIVEARIVPPVEVDPDVPPEISAVCMKALAPKRYLRYASATDFAEDLQRFMAGTPVRAYSPPLKQRVKTWMATHPTLTQAILLLTSLMVIGGAAIAYTARQGTEALRDARYAAVKDFAHDLEVNLNFETDGLIRNLHFVGDLPLMEAIVFSHDSSLQNHAGENHALDPTNATDDSAAAGASGPTQRDGTQRDGTQAGEPAATLSREEKLFRDSTPDEWLGRQGQLYDGLLKANPSYLTAATCRYLDGGEVSELVRSDRIHSGGRVNRVPKKQLLTHIPSASENPEARILETLRPEQVVLVTNDQVSDDILLRTRSPLVMSGLRPIFDANGEPFGMTFIELDLRSRLEELCMAVAPEHVSVCITDTSGRIVARYDEGQFTDGDESSVIDQFPELKNFFLPDATVTEIGDGETFFAKRVHFGDETSKAEIGLVVHIH